ncbi:heme lyase subunit, putative [Babesia ovata]|uniref:Heme lyase subunit, putative n=1 Tax=Babesia ovata TaxID=189622 RepID=A0A2H6KD71_9APIC|nr:heme lyase subunit, putative [Babesia ovata]GBE60946.1 heme lyase subunit, putative [Babesia ovata]
MSDLSELTAELNHFSLNVRVLTLLTYFPSRLPNRRRGRFLDLCLSLAVELVNGGFKTTNFFLKIFCDFSKSTSNPGLYITPHFLQLAVHGLGGAFLVGGAGLLGVGRLVKLFIEILGYSNRIIQRLCDVYIAVFAAHPVVCK